MTVSHSSPSSTAHLAVEAVSKHYPGQTALETVSLHVERGRYVVLLGPSGSGKTTLLSLIGGFTLPSSGIIRIGGQDVTDLPPAKRPTTTVFQDYALFPHMTVAANIEFGLKLRGLKADARKTRVAEMLELVGLGQHGERSIQALSGGQRQRVALARALAVEPEILLLDEPLGALDLALRRQMQDELHRIQRQMNRTFVHVTHDQEEAMALADLIVVMSHGRIEDMGPPRRVYMRPATRFAATFMGESTQIEGHIHAQDGQVITLETDIGLLRGMAAPMSGALTDNPADTQGRIWRTGDKAVAIIRPENIRTVAQNGQAMGQALVCETVFQGNYVRVFARSETGQSFVLHSPARQVPASGEIITPYALMEDITIVPAQEN
ncbi:ABC transporter ATP-binding protein [Acetobacter papayae]|uniref:ABC transporter ATP-binding protein n=1 Tax=Acetobacter papayae TaxID=1076592 RepID=UPI00047226DA|nr:ABC transporter ATP-binding protein [Acetobacter papayae]